MAALDIPADPIPTHHVWSARQSRESCRDLKSRIIRLSQEHRLWGFVKMSVLPFSCRWPCRLSRLLVGGLGFDEGSDPVVQFADRLKPPWLPGTMATSACGMRLPRAWASAGVSMALRAPVISRTGTSIARSSSSVRMPNPACLPARTCIGTSDQGYPWLLWWLAFSDQCSPRDRAWPGTLRAPRL